MSYKLLKTMWACCCFSPLLYSLAALILYNLLGWTTGSGLHPLDPDTYDRVTRYGIGYALAVQCSFLFIMWRIWAVSRAGSLTPAQALSLLTRRCVTQVFLSETIVLFGFGLFLVQGDLKAVIGFAITAMFFYAQSYPMPLKSREQ